MMSRKVFVSIGTFKDKVAVSVHEEGFFTFWIYQGVTPKSKIMDVLSRHQKYNGDLWIVKHIEAECGSKWEGMTFPSSSEEFKCA